jgi:two-component sensor histidine kinase
MPISNRSFVQFTTVLLVVGFVALLGIVGMTIWLGEQAQEHFAEVIDARDARSSAVELRNAVQSAESSQRGFLLTGNEIYLAPYDLAKLTAERQLEALKRSLARFPDTAVPLERLTALISEKTAEMDETIALKRERRDLDVLGAIRTNRGKALMDEANVFFAGVIRAADARLTAAVDEQRSSATRLRLISVLGGIVIVMVVGGATVAVVRYTRELAAARDEVAGLNASLEQRVKNRTADLAQANEEIGRARDRAELLLAEVNHRVANSLTLVGSLVGLQARGVQDKVAKDVLAETQGRIQAISLVHRRLYTSGDVRFVELDEYLSALLDHLSASMKDQGHGASLSYRLDPLRLPTDTSINLGVVVTEWVTNAFKYAYPDRRGEVRVRLQHLPEGRVELAVEDDGVGRNDDIAAKGTGLGTRLVRAMAQNMSADVEYQRRQPGTLARLTFAREAA